MSFGNEREFIDHIQNASRKEGAMICPLLAIATPGDMKQAHRSLICCTKEECAWWDKMVDRCSVYRAMTCLESIAGSLKAIYEKMPHEEQKRTG